MPIATSERKVDAVTVFHGLLKLHQFDRLGGADSFFGRQHVLRELLDDAHTAAGESWHGMNCYGNCICPKPTLEAFRAWRALGYSLDELTHQAEFFAAQKTPDALVLEVMVKHYGDVIYAEVPVAAEAAIA